MEDGIKLCELYHGFYALQNRVNGVIAITKLGVQMTPDALHEFCTGTFVREYNGKKLEIGIFDMVAIYAEVENG